MHLRIASLGLAIVTMDVSLHHRSCHLLNGNGVARCSQLSNALGIAHMCAAFMQISERQPLQADLDGRSTVHKHPVSSRSGGREGSHAAARPASKGSSVEKRDSTGGLTNDSIMSGATSDQQESYSSFLGVGSESRGHGSDEEIQENRDAAGRRERERGRGEGRQLQSPLNDSRLDESMDCASVDSQSSAMASMLSMPSGPAPLQQAGCFPRHV